MMDEMVLFCNWCFFVVVVMPSMVRVGIQTFKYFQILDIFYNSFYDKLKFCIAMMLVMYKQWMNGNVVRKDKNTYEITAVLDGELHTILLERDDEQHAWKPLERM
jgi:short subunit fatty acids transporter